MTGRRTFLGKLAATGAAAATGVVVLPSPPESAATAWNELDESAGIDDLAKARSDGGTEAVAALNLPWIDGIETESESPIARWQYRSTAAGHEPTSPINVVFPLPDARTGASGNADIDAVMGVLDDAGWTRTFEEYVRYAWDRRTETYVRQEATAAETYFGTSGRLHVRCWEFEGVVSMQAHEDTSARPKHGVGSYRRARAVIETLFASAGWTVLSAVVDLENDKPPDHDGRASVIVPGDRRE